MSTEILARNPSFGVQLYCDDGLRADISEYFSTSRSANPSYELGFQIWFCRWVERW
jgi:hypothetical protein